MNVLGFPDLYGVPLGVVQNNVSYIDIVKSIAPANLVAYWPLNETSGTTANDASGNGRHGSYNSVVLNATTGVDGGPAIQFNADGDWVNLYSANLAAAFPKQEGTFVIWARVRAQSVWTDGAFRFLARFADGTTDDQVLFQKSSGAGLVVYQYAAAGTIEAYTLNVNTPNWIMLTQTWSKAAEEVKYYINGVLMETDTTLGIWVDNLFSTLALLGNSIATGTPTGWWDGYEQHAALWNTPLSQAQITTLYNNGFGRQAAYTSYINSLAPVLWLKMQETSGTTAANSGSGGSALNATIAGTTAVGRFGALEVNEAFDYDGSTSLVTVPNNAAINALSEFTYAMLIRPESAGEGSVARLWNWGNSSPGHRAETTAVYKLLVVVAMSGSNASTTATNNTLVPNVWQWIFVTFSESGDKTIRVYMGKNGTVTEPSYDAQTAGTGNVTSRGEDLIIGNRALADATFDGQFDDVAIFSRVLTTAEMLQLITLTGV